MSASSLQRRAVAPAPVSRGRDSIPKRTNSSRRFSCPSLDDSLPACSFSPASSTVEEVELDSSDDEIELEHIEQVGGPAERVHSHLKRSPPSTPLFSSSSSSFFPPPSRRSPRPGPFAKPEAQGLHSPPATPQLSPPLDADALLGKLGHLSLASRPVISGNRLLVRGRQQLPTRRKSAPANTRGTKARSPLATTCVLAEECGMSC